MSPTTQVWGCTKCCTIGQSRTVTGYEPAEPVEVSAGEELNNKFQLQVRR